MTMCECVRLLSATRTFVRPHCALTHYHCLMKLFECLNGDLPANSPKISVKMDFAGMSSDDEFSFCNFVEKENTMHESVLQKIFGTVELLHFQKISKFLKKFLYV